jgi:SAM-dependent methyltransferase
MTDTATSYDHVPYSFSSFPESHPRRLQAAAHLLGLETPAPAECRVLELGCAVGGNIVPMAYSLPGASLIGIDRVTSQIETAREFAAASDVKNLDLRAASIADVTPEWGKFDYVIAHGVFSWVPRDVAEQVLQICAEQLTQNGLAYISFNTYPGWHGRMWARDAMLFHAEKFEDPIEKVRAGRDFIAALAQSPLASGLLKSEMQYLQGKAESYILHEYLEDVNEPIYFRDFAGLVAKHGLQYLGDALQNGMMGAESWPAFMSWMQANRDDLIRREQYVDFARNRVFRRALVCRGSLALDRTRLVSRAETMQIAGYLQQSIDANGMSRFDHVRGGLVTGAGPLRDALVTINARFPRAISVQELIDLAGHQRGALLHELVNCWMSGMLELYIDPPAVLAQASSDRPRASPIARYLVAQNQTPINQRNASVPVDATQRRFIQLVDGTRTRDQLATELGTARENIDRLIQSLLETALLEA